MQGLLFSTPCFHPDTHNTTYDTHSGTRSGTHNEAGTRYTSAPKTKHAPIHGGSALEHSAKGGGRKHRATMTTTNQPGSKLDPGPPKHTP